MKVKLLALFFIIVLILNLVLFGMGKIPDLVFWAVIIVCAIGSYAINKSKKV